MKQLFLMVNDGSVSLIDTPAPTPKANHVIVETEYSVISAGTERGLANFGSKNLVQKAMERPDQVRQVLDKMAQDGVLSTMESAFQRLKDPMPMGYSGVGRIVSIGTNVTNLRSGDRVAMVGQAYHSEINRVNKNLIAFIPETDKDIRQFALAALGGIALQGIHQAKVLPGETVAIIGLGLIGHVCARILDAYGCDVIAFDVADKSLEKTRLKAFIYSTDENAAEKVKALTNGIGVDKVIITAATNSNAPMDLASGIIRDRGTICMIGVTQMNIDRRPYYEKELTFTIARSYGPGRYDKDYEEKGVDLPVGYVRFTQGRNIQEFVRLITEGRLNLTDLITHVIPFEEAVSAYELITTNKNKVPYLAVLLEYSAAAAGKFERKIVSKGTAAAKDLKPDIIKVGLIGAGNFARNTILPQLQKSGRYSLRGLATTGGVSAAQASASFKFDYITSNYRDILEDPEIDLVIISTNHNTHASFISEALRANKNVYCEKPLCLSLDELNMIERIYRASPAELFCGLNRRHSPLVKAIKSELKTDQVPSCYNYVVNAGFIPQDHWTQDEEVGGGRLIGEACHFVDTIQFLDGSMLTKLDLSYARSTSYPKDDNAVLTLGFESGALATILYTAMGSKIYSKEKLHVFSGGAVADLHNYTSLSVYGIKKKRISKLRQDKGVYHEYAFIADCLNGKARNDAIEDAFIGHRMLLNAMNNKTEVSGKVLE